MSEITDLSETDADNTTISGANVAENCAFSGLNNAIRNLAGMVKRGYDRLTGHYASTGSANAYVLTPDAALSAYVTGERYSFRANFANTGAATLNISGLGAKTIKKMTILGKADLSSGDIQNGQPVTVEYDGTDLIMVTPAAGRVCFLTSKGGVDQGSIVTATVTKVTLGTESFDVGGYFDASTSKFTPPAGKYRLTANIHYKAGIVDGEEYRAIIQQSGSTAAQTIERAKGTNPFTVSVTMLVDADGTDYFEVYAYGAGTGNKTIDGGPALTYFCGEAI